MTHATFNESTKYLRCSLERGQTNTFTRSGWMGQDEEHLEARSAALISCTQPTDARKPSSNEDAPDMTRLEEVKVQRRALPIRSKSTLALNSVPMG